jgi:hypothetical protein
MEDRLQPSSHPTGGKTGTDSLYERGQIGKQVTRDMGVEVLDGVGYGASTPLAECRPELIPRPLDTAWRHSQAGLQASRDGVAQEAAIPGSVDGALGDVDREPKLLGQESGDRGHDPLTGTPRPHIDVAVVGTRHAWRAQQKARP